jgi:DNA-binding CsgD family transcriptional regulator
LTVELGGFWLGDFTRAHQLLEEAAIAPDRLADILNEAGRAIGFDQFRVRHHETASDLDSAGVTLGDRLQLFARPDWRARPDHRGTIGTRLHGSQRNETTREADTGAGSDGFPLANGTVYGAGWRLTSQDDAWDFVLLRAEQRGPVSAVEAEQIEQLIPVANRVPRLLHALRTIYFRGIFDGLSATQTAAVLLKRDGSVELATPLAQRLFNTDFDIREGRLWSAHASSNDHLEALAQRGQRADASGSLRPFLIVRLNDPRAILAQPLIVPGPGGGSPGSARVAVFLSAPGQTEPADENDLKLLFGLSKAEARIARLLAEGLEPRQIAESRNVSVGTIRVQMKHIFHKMRVHRQSELISTMAELRPAAPFACAHVAGPTQGTAV